METQLYVVEICLVIVRKSVVILCFRFPILTVFCWVALQYSFFNSKVNKELKIDSGILVIVYLLTDDFSIHYNLTKTMASMNLANIIKRKLFFYFWPELILLREWLIILFFSTKAFYLNLCSPKISLFLIFFLQYIFNRQVRSCTTARLLLLQSLCNNIFTNCTKVDVDDNYIWIILKWDCN